MQIRSLPGGVPEPDELIGRDHLINVLWDHLAGSNILLVAPRRFGKTGVMRHVLKRPRTGYLPLYLEVEDIHTHEAFAAELIGALLEQDRLRSLISGMKRLPGRIAEVVTKFVEEVDIEEVKLKLRDAFDESWERVAKRLVLEMEKADETIVFIIDEFPQLVDNVSRKQGEDAARSQLSWFRSLRMRQKDELRRFRFILGGSTGIDMILRRLNSSDKLNDFFRLPVEALTREDAEILLSRLAVRYEISITSEAIEDLFKLIGPPVPYFIHLFVSQILIDPQAKGKTLTPDDIKDVYERRLIGPTCRSYFEYNRQRLKRYGAPAERAAILILRGIAEAPGGRVSDSTLYDVYRKARKKGASDIEFREIMSDLECDWYVSLDTTTNEYFFLMDIMKAWWKRFYRSLNTRRK